MSTSTFVTQPKHCTHSEMLLVSRCFCLFVDMFTLAAVTITPDTSHHILYAQHITICSVTTKLQNGCKQFFLSGKPITHIHKWILYIHLKIKLQWEMLFSGGGGYYFRLTIYTRGRECSNRRFYCNWLNNIF